MLSSPISRRLSALIRRLRMARGTGSVSPLLVRRSHALRSCILRVEELEPRTVPASIDPAQIRTAYGFDRIITDGSLPGTGQTIAIVAAYDHRSEERRV